MSKRRKRRRMAFINRMNEILKENPTLSLDAAKTRTSIEIKNALREADRRAPHNREEHHEVFERTLFGKNQTNNKATKATTTTKATAAPTTAKPKTTTTTVNKPTTTAKTTTKKRTTTKRTKKTK